jgi:hypothetical protein
VYQNQEFFQFMNKWRGLVSPVSEEKSAIGQRGQSGGSGLAPHHQATDFARILSGLRLDFSQPNEGLA